MPTTITTGAHGVRKAVHDFLLTGLPTQMAFMKDVWGIADIEWRDPKRYYMYEPETLEVFPCVVVNCSGIIETTMDGVDDSTYEPVFLNMYAMRVYAWILAGKTEDTSRLRDYLMTAIRTLLASHPGLAIGGCNEDLDANVDIGSMRDDYSDTVGYKVRDNIAGGYISFNVQVSEQYPGYDPATLTEIVSVEEMVTALERDSSDLVEEV